MPDQYYTGIGSRQTPDTILELMTKIATKLAHQGVILRSGGAAGADLAFEYACNKVPGGRKEIYLAHQATEEAMTLVSQFHDAWDKCSPYIRQLHGRNAFQVLGLDLNTPSKCVICWTPDGCHSHATRTRNTGGIGTAISVASHFKVPVYNLAHLPHHTMWTNWLNK